jgi:hypothetical protein
MVCCRIDFNEFLARQRFQIVVNSNRFQYDPCVNSIGSCAFPANTYIHNLRSYGKHRCTMMVGSQRAPNDAGKERKWLVGCGGCSPGRLLWLCDKTNERGQPTTGTFRETKKDLQGRRSCYTLQDRRSGDRRPLLTERQHHFRLERLPPLGRRAGIRRSCRAVCPSCFLRSPFAVALESL